ncbi:MAG: group II intron maturase-specific domain-containing protein [Planctomycetota bacterium]|jgi:hypothetical protein
MVSPGGQQIEPATTGGDWEAERLEGQTQETGNRTLRGWYEYFKHSWKTIFPDLDSWVRMRLRSIL